MECETCRILVLSVKTANNEEALKEICEFLENEAYPLLGYEIEVRYERE